MELSERLASLRKQRGYSLRELQKRIEDQTGERLAVSYLSSLERTNREPSVTTIRLIAWGYDMSMMELLMPTGLLGPKVESSAECG